MHFLQKIIISKLKYAYVFTKIYNFKIKYAFFYKKLQFLEQNLNFFTKINPCSAWIESAQMELASASKWSQPASML
jgi:hypothetical protein